MMTVLALDEYRPRCTGTAVCMACKHEWPAVAPVGTAWLECPECGLHHGMFKYPHLREDRLHWKCNCTGGGNELFYVTPEGIYCPECGEWQQGY